jgi:hypothetical protein
VQLQKGPLALLGAFALKVGGRNPPAFGDTITPTIDVYDQYIATSELQVKNVVLATALSTFNQALMPVPAGKAWRVLAASFFGSLNAADVALLTGIAIGALAPGGASSCNLASAFQEAGATPRSLAFTLRPPLFLPSGWQLAFAMFTNTAITVTSNIQCNALVQELDL